MSKPRAGKFEPEMSQFDMAARKDGYAYVPNGRKEKRMVRRMCGSQDMVYQAYLEGQSEAESRKPRPNPYPPGKRHAAYEDGLKYADPMGDHMGRNQ